MAAIIIFGLFFFLFQSAESVCFIANFKEARCAINDLRAQRLSLVDTLFVPGGEEAVRLPPDRSRLTTVVCDRCPCMLDPENEKGMKNGIFSEKINNIEYFCFPRGLEKRP